MYSSGSVIIVLAALVSAVLATCGPWIPLNVSNLPKANPKDQIDVNYLAAPLEECQYDDDFWWLSAFHGALSFRNRRTGFVITINFEASPSFQGALVPTIVKEANGTVELEWQNSGAIFAYKGQNDTYWDEAIIPIASMDGTVYNNFMNWIAEANFSVPYYNLWAVWTDWPGKLLLPNYECFAFVWTMFEELHDLGAKFDPNVKVKQSFIALYSNSQPTVADENDPVVMNDIVDFYEAVEAKINSTGMIGFLTELWDIVVDGNFYVRRDDKYYHVILDHFPYFGIHYTNVAMPWEV